MVKSPAGLTDEELAKEIREKNKDWYGEIINRYQAKLLRYAVYLSGDRHEAEDIVENALIKAYMNLNSFNLNQKFSSWIYRIVHNEAVNLLKKRKKTVSLEQIDFDSGLDLEDELVKKDLKVYARDCLDKMELKYREPLSLYFLEEKSYTEISEILRLPPSTVGTRIKRAKIIMKKICQNLKK
jgi:RNA polymerase sigma-70 factor (ECF subfamily)